MILNYYTKIWNNNEFLSVTNCNEIFKNAHYDKPEFDLIRWCDYTNRLGLTLNIVKYEDSQYTTALCPTTTIIYFINDKNGTVTCSKRVMSKNEIKVFQNLWQLLYIRFIASLSQGICIKCSQGQNFKIKV